MRSDRILVIGAAVALTMFMAAIFQLFETRVESGDIYPVYSSLRADAGGTKAFYESLGQLTGIVVERGFQPLIDFQARGSTVFVLGVPPQSVSEYDTTANRGNRLIVGLPVCTADKPEATIWDTSLRCVQGSNRPGYHVFTRLGGQWHTIARDRGGAPVAAERKHGSGSVVILADTYMLTNEALLRERNTELLAALLGNNRRVVFDEHHLGISEQHGVVSLARRYRLHWFAAGLLLTSVLFIWRNASSFLPRVDERFADEEVSGRTAASGLTNLLGRAIPRSDLLRICTSEWLQSTGRRASEEQIARISQIAQNSEPVEGYRAITQLVGERRRP